jgi:hypothetical protein
VIHHRRRTQRARLGALSPRAGAGDAVNYGVVDKFTVAHVASGALLGFTPLPWWGALALTIGFELVEPYMQEAFPQWRVSSTRETVANSISDVVVAMLAYWAVKAIPT